MPFFKSPSAREADILLKNAHKLLHQRRDLLSDATIADAETAIKRLEDAVAANDETEIKNASDDLDKTFSRFQPAAADSSLRENCEVLLVALVLAIGIRAYFLQPFKIPTGSMQPTLNGLVAVDVKPEQPLPNVLVRAFQYVWLGRTYADAVSVQDDRVTSLEPIKHLGLLSYTRVGCASGRHYDVYAPREKMSLGRPEFFDLYVGRTLRAGESIVHGYVDAGDQVFVDKFTYNFRKPAREDVFVFSTAGIEGTRRSDMDPEIKSEFYIKRLAGIAGDTLRIAQPQLFLNGALAQGKRFARVMSLQNGYHGYSNTIPPYLTSRDQTFTVPAESYFALGDNSFNSSDSRHWGVVPAPNVIGRGLFVYYPFTRHWGLIR